MSASGITLGEGLCLSLLCRLPVLSKSKSPLVMAASSVEHPTSKNTMEKLMSSALLDSSTLLINLKRLGYVSSGKILRLGLINVAPPFQSGIIKSRIEVFDGWLCASGNNATLKKWFSDWLSPPAIQNTTTPPMMSPLGCLYLNSMPVAFPSSSAIIQKSREPADGWLRLSPKAPCTSLWLCAWDSPQTTQKRTKRRHVFSGDLARSLSISTSILLRNTISSKWAELSRMTGFALLKRHNYSTVCSGTESLLSPLKWKPIQTMFPPTKLNNYQICLLLCRRKTTSSK